MAVRSRKVTRVELRQVVRYTGATRDEALARMRAEPVTPIPPVPDGWDTYGPVVRHLLQPVVVPDPGPSDRIATVRRVALGLLGAPFAAINAGEGPDKDAWD